MALSLPAHTCALKYGVGMSKPAGKSKRFSTFLPSKPAFAQSPASARETFARARSNRVLRVPSVAAAKGAQADIAAKGLALKGDLLARGVCQVAGGLEGLAERGHVEHAAAGGDELALLVHGGAGVVHGLSLIHI